MNKVKDIAIAVIVLAVICAVMWIIGWISSFSDVAKLYGILVIVIIVSTVYGFIKGKFVR